MMMMRGFMCHPFTDSQLKELELQTLIFHHLASGLPIPPHLIAHFKTSFYFLDHFPLQLSMSIGSRRAEEDPEPWRCKRTDGKKWRCSKEAFKDSKYCERHMHRGKKSSRKLVETSTTLINNSSSSNNNSTHLFLGSDQCEESYSSQCYNFFKQEERERKRQQQQQQQHCYVLGADLMQQVHKPKTVLCLFSDCADSEEAYSKTQLSISIS